MQPRRKKVESYEEDAGQALESPGSGPIKEQQPLRAQPAAVRRAATHPGKALRWGPSSEVGACKSSLHCFGAGLRSHSGAWLCHKVIHRALLFGTLCRCCPCCRPPVFGQCGCGGTARSPTLRPAALHSRTAAGHTEPPCCCCWRRCSFTPSPAIRGAAAAAAPAAPTAYTAASGSCSEGAACLRAASLGRSSGAGALAAACWPAAPCLGHSLQCCILPGLIPSCPPGESRRHAALLCSAAPAT